MSGFFPGLAGRFFAIKNLKTFFLSIQNPNKKHFFRRENMKPLRCLVPVFFLVLALSFSAHAQLPVGTWNAPGDFEPGEWKELLKGGSEGATDNEITAFSKNYYSFEGALLESVDVVTPPDPNVCVGGTLYKTVYKGGTLTLITNDNLSPWYISDSPDDHIIKFDKCTVLTCKYDDPEKTMSFVLYAKVQTEDPGFPKYEVEIKAEYLAGTPIKDDPDTPTSITGKLDTAQITITIPPTAAVDIKPGSCPNPINVKSRGVIPMAILGSADLIVSSINEESIYLTNGALDASAKLIKVYPIRKAYEDVGTPFEPLGVKDDRLACHNLDGDGQTDMTLKFLTEDVVAAFKLTEAPDRSTQEWFIMFEMDGGTQMVGSDVVWILNKERNARNREQSGETNRYRMKHQKN
jgi:hypothetical protein